ncbi:MAG TPA: proline dehydrogenase family protein [Candidatus Limnocylindria bacterium]
MTVHTGRALAGILPLLPRSILWAVAKRYVAGSTLEDALRVTAELTGRNRLVTLDVLGEQFSSREQVMSMMSEYERALGKLQHDDPSATLSVMMTGFGLRLDPDLCWENLRRLAKDAADRVIGLTLNMEDSSTVDATLDVYRRLRAEGFDGVGIVLQSRLRRTLDDLAALAHLRPRVRIVKGIWHEPESLAYLDDQTIRRNYLAVLERLAACGGYPEVATHDEWLIERSAEVLASRSPAQYEFQMLLGVTPKRGDKLIAAGHRLRVYVPYGRDWYAYSLRRLRENPEMAQYIARDTIAELFTAR